MRRYILSYTVYKLLLKGLSVGRSSEYTFGKRQSSLKYFKYQTCRKPTINFLNTSKELQHFHFLDAAFRQSPRPIAIIDRSLTIIMSNKAFEEMFLVKKEGLQRKKITEIMQLQDVDYLCRYSTSRNEGRILFGTGWRHDEKFSVRITARLIDYGHRAKWIIHGVDLTMLEQAAWSQSDFVSMVSHELRTPLSSISGALGLVRAGKTGVLSNDTSEMIDIAVRNTSRIIRLINDVLDIKQMDAGKLKFIFEDHNLTDLVNQAVREITPLAASSGIDLVIEGASIEAKVYVDNYRAVQVITNLISNAIKFSPAGGQVLVRINSEIIPHQIQVIDNGIGIPSDFRNRVFEKFARATSDGNTPNGTGLGLAISRQIVENLRGNLWFDDNPNGGTIFYLELPSAGQIQGANLT